MVQGETLRVLRRDVVGSATHGGVILTGLNSCRKAEVSDFLQNDS